MKKSTSTLTLTDLREGKWPLGSTPYSSITLHWPRFYLKVNVAQLSKYHGPSKSRVPIKFAVPTQDMCPREMAITRGFFRAGFPFPLVKKASLVFEIWRQGCQQYRDRLKGGPAPMLRKSRFLAPSGRGGKFTQPRTHLLADHCSSRMKSYAVIMHG